MAKGKEKPVLAENEDDLTEIPGVGATIAEKFKAAGYYAYEQIAFATPKEIAEAEICGEDTAAKYISAARKFVNVGNFITASELKDKRANLKRVTTCSVAMDSMFTNPKDPEGQKGIPSQSISEFFGEFGSGKSQICFQMAVNCTMPIEKGGLDADCLFIDTENTFRPSRIEQIAQALGLDEKETLNRIHVASALSANHQILLLEQRAYEIAKEKNIGMIIIDSLTSHFRSEYLGRGMLQERQSLLAKHMRELLRFCYQNNVVGIVTNQVLTNPGQMFGDPTKPVGGNIVGHASTYRLYMRKAKGGKRVARMIDSPDIPECEVIIHVSEAGVRDNEASE